LDGKVKFGGVDIQTCAPTYETWNRQKKYFFDMAFERKYPGKKLVLKKSCRETLDGIDMIILRGDDLVRSRDIPSDILLDQSFRMKSLSILVTVTANSFKDEFRRREILSNQYTSDVVGETRVGFGAVTVDVKSEVGCLVIPRKLKVHRKSISSVVQSRIFQFGTHTTRFVSVDVTTAFKRLQKGECGLVYAGQDDLKRVIEGSRKIDLAFMVLPVWTSKKQIENESSRKTRMKVKTQQSESDRIARLKSKLKEEKIRRKRESAALSNRQKEYRRIHGAKVSSLVANIEKQLIGIRNSIKSSLDEKLSFRETVKGHELWGRFPRWYAKKIQSGWDFDSMVSVPKDYGFVLWKNRQVESIVSETRVLMKNRSIGAYSDDCWYVGYLNDTEFSVLREPFVAKCSETAKLKDWKINNRFETRWDLGVK
jgi:hypothetical protein